MPELVSSQLTVLEAQAIRAIYDHEWSGSRIRTARRDGDTTGQSLRMRRTWWVDPPVVPPVPPTPPADPAKPDPAKPDEGADKDKDKHVDPLDAWVTTLPKESQAGALALVLELRQTRGEAKDRRLKAEEQARKEAEAEAKRKQDEADRLAKQGEWETLATTQKVEIADLKTFKEKAERYEAAFQTLLKKRLESVPEIIRPLLEGKDPIETMAWLDANGDKLNQRQAPGADGGKRGDGVKPPPDAKNVLRPTGY